MKSFNNFYEEVADAATQQPKRTSDDAFAVFGRHNPPHLGHGLVLDKASQLAGSIGDKAPADQMFYTSHSQDPKKNPLPHQLKLHFLKQMFPKHADKWDDDENVKTILGAATKAGNKGYKNFHFVGGGDRKQGMEDLLRKYNGNLYNFDNIYSHSAGERTEQEVTDLEGQIEKLGLQNPESESGKANVKKRIEEFKKKIFLAKLSASKMRGFAQSGNMEDFAKGLPIGKNFTMDDAQSLFNAVNLFSQKNEEFDYHENKEYLGELYRTGRLYQEGDEIESLINGLSGKVHRCGANHLICVTEDGIMFKSFIHDVHSI